MAFLKTVFIFCQGYLTWPRPFSWVGWKVVELAVSINDMPFGSALWNLVEPINLPWWLVRTEVLVGCALVFACGVTQRAANVLQSGLAEAYKSVQQELWRRELLGYPEPPPQQVIGVQINVNESSPAPPSPWWTKPWGLILISVVASVAAAVLGQWLNLELGLAH
jgi:hypothetical protein